MTEVAIIVERRPEWRARYGWRVVAGGLILAEFCVCAEVGLTEAMCEAEARAFAERLAALR